MQDKLLIRLIESGIKFYREFGKSADLANFLMNIEVTEPSLLMDFDTELALTLHPDEEDGVGCYSIDDIDKALKEYKHTGKTNLFD